MGKQNDFEPDWYEQSPPEQSYRSILKWGSPTEFKHPNKGLYQLMKQTFNLSDDYFKTKIETGDEQVKIQTPIQLSNDHIARLKEIVGEENVKLSDYDRLSVAYGKTMIDLMRLRKQIAENLPDAVVCPKDKNDVQKIVEYCNKNTIPITVFGLGSSVTRGVECTKGGITLDMRAHMNKILSINPINQSVTVQPGVSGPKLEEGLNDAPNRFNTKHRYTCGHFPQSFEFSSVGGWLVTRGSGQNSTYYGDADKLVLSQVYITPAGEIITNQDFPGKATGPDLDQIMLGSEGAYGILVEATLKIFRYHPENTARFSFIFKDWGNAVNAVREIMQSQIGLPSAFRLSDPEETDVGLKLYGIEGTFIDKLISLRGLKPGERCLLIGSADGDKSYTRLVKKKVKKIARKYKGIYITGFPTKQWEHGRFRDPYMREDLQDYGIMIDTLECSVRWDNLMDVWNGVRDYIHSREQTICMSHMSHFYPQGTNLYFIFIAKINEIKEYLDFQYGILDNIRKHGASMSHHHGIGKMIAPWMEKSIGRNEMELLRAIKHHLDPNNIMNPGGTLGLDLPEDQKR